MKKPSLQQYSKWIASFLFTLCCLGSQTLYAKTVMPSITHWTTRANIPVYFVETHQNPILDLQLIFNAGSAYDGKQHGLARLTNQMLAQGTQNISQKQIAIRLDDLAAQYSAKTTKNSAMVSLRSLTQPPAMLDKALQLFQKMITQTNVPPAELSKEKKRQINALKQQQTNVTGRAAQTFLQHLYPHHPYGHLPIGYQKTIAPLTRENVLHFYHRYYTAKQATICMVGDLSIERAHAIAEQLSHALPTGKAIPEVPPPPFPQKAQTIHVDFPTTQTHVLMGEVSRLHKPSDFYALTVANHILGGGILVSRLFQNIREKQGLAYHAASYFDLVDGTHAPFQLTIQLQTRNEQAKKAIHTLQETLNRFVEAGPNAQELRAAKAYLTQSYPRRFTSNQAIIAQLVDLVLKHHPLNFWEDYAKNINNVTLLDVKRVSNQLIHPQQMLTLIVQPTPHKP